MPFGKKKTTPKEEGLESYKNEITVLNKILEDIKNFNSISNTNQSLLLPGHNNLIIFYNVLDKIILLTNKYISEYLLPEIRKNNQEGNFKQDLRGIINALNKENGDSKGFEPFTLDWSKGQAGLYIGPFQTQVEQLLKNMKQTENNMISNIIIQVLGSEEKLYQTNSQIYFFLKDNGYF